MRFQEVIPLGESNRIRQPIIVHARLYRHGPNPTTPPSCDGIAVAETGKYMVLGVGQASLFAVR
jgi:hypothetical protein